MYNKITAILLAAIVLLFAGCPLLDTPVAIRGRVDFDAPVDGALIELFNAQSGASIWKGEAPGGNFIGLVSPLRQLFAQDGFILQATGGQVAGQPFTETLQAYIPTSKLTDHQEINIVSTLIVAYMYVAGVSHDDAVTDVLDYLQIPRDYPYLDAAHQDASDQYFDEEHLLYHAEENGGLDAYIAALAEDEIEQGAAQLFSALNAIHYPEPGDEAEKSGEMVAGRIFSAVVSGITSGIAGSVADVGIDYALSLLGISNGPSSQDSEVIATMIREMSGQINAKLDTIGSTLNGIESQTAAIAAQLTSLQHQLQIDTDLLNQNISAVNLNGYETSIESLYSAPGFSYIALLDPAQASSDPDTMRDDVKFFAAQILDSSRNDYLPTILSRIHTSLISNQMTSSCYLDVCMKLLLDKLDIAPNDPALLWTCYLELETEFSKILAMEAKALTMITGAINVYRDELPGFHGAFAASTQQFQHVAPPFSHRNFTAEQYLAQFQLLLDMQADKFLSCVDRLIVRRMDMRTDLANPKQVLPDNTQAVYERADFLVSRLTQRSARRPVQSGLVVRLIGAPTEIQELMTNIQLVEHMNRREVHYYVSPFGDDWGRATGWLVTDSKETKNIPLTPVNVYNGNPIGNSGHVNGYDTPKYGDYVAWDRDDQGLIIRVDNKIGVAKLISNDLAASTTVVQMLNQYLSRTEVAGEEGQTTRELPGVQGEVAGGFAGLMKRYADDFTLSADPGTGTPYANLVFVVGGSQLTAKDFVESRNANITPGVPYSAAFDPSSLKMDLSVGWNMGPPYLNINGVNEILLKANVRARDNCKVAIRCTTSSNFVYASVGGYWAYNAIHYDSGVQWNPGSSYSPLVHSIVNLRDDLVCPNICEYRRTFNGGTVETPANLTAGTPVDLTLNGKMQFDSVYCTNNATFRVAYFTVNITSMEVIPK